MQRHEVVSTSEHRRTGCGGCSTRRSQPDEVRAPHDQAPGRPITILRDGDDAGEGLVRTATFPVPRWLLSGGRARSFEVVVEARKNEYARYHAEGKPLWSHAEGWHTLEPIDEGAGTRLTFVETYHAHNRVLRALFEQRVHRHISRDNRRSTRRSSATSARSPGSASDVRGFCVRETSVCEGFAHSESRGPDGRAQGGHRS